MIINFRFKVFWPFFFTIYTKVKYLMILRLNNDGDGGNRGTKMMIYLNKTGVCVLV